MKKLSESLIINKNSKFYGYMYEISNINEVTDILSILKQKNKKAKHICYAYKLGIIERKYEDKEPSNTAGLPILEVIKRNNFIKLFLLNILFLLLFLILSFSTTDLFLYYIFFESRLIPTFLLIIG